MGKAQIVTNNVNLSELKAAKDAELSVACAASITDPYQSKIVLESDGKAHLYGTDTYDQLNMQQQLIMMLADRSMVTVSYKAKGNGFIDHTREEFIAVVKEIGDLVKVSRQKLGALRIMLTNAKTEEEIVAINWNSI